MRIPLLPLVACAALAACAPPPPAHELAPERDDQIVADAFLHNATTSPIPVRVRSLGDDRSLDCELVLADPGGTLAARHFDRASSWLQPPGTNAALLPIAMRTEAAHMRGCYAVMVEVDDAEAMVFAWSRDALPTRPVDLASANPDELPPGAVVVSDRGQAIGLCPKGNLVVAHAE